MAEPTTAHTVQPASPAKAPFPPFERDTFPSQLFWLAISFIALYVMTARLVRPRVGGIIEGRNQRISGDLAEAARLKGESEAALADYEKALNDARARAQTIAGETRDRLQGEADRNRKTLEDQLTARLADAEKSIAATKTAAMTANVRGISATDAAAAIVTSAHRHDGAGSRRSARRSTPCSRKQRLAAMHFEFDAEFWVAVAFVIFIGVLIKLGAHRVILGALDDRGARIKAELDEARA